MGILSRAVRLCKADLHGVMDQMEDKDLLLRQHLREMQAALAERQARIDQLEETLRAGKRNRSRVAQHLQNLEEDLDRAVWPGSGRYRPHVDPQGFFFAEKHGSDGSTLGGDDRRPGRGAGAYGRSTAGLG